MKHLIILTLTFCSLIAVQTIYAQDPVALLEHSDSTRAYYGQGAFVAAYKASANGDKIYLSAGSFTSPDTIARGLKIYGAGHFFIEGKQTILLAGLYLKKGADSLRLEGMDIRGYIKFDGSNPINYIKIIRCRTSSIFFHSTSASAGKNYCSIEECFVDGGIYFNNYGNNLWVRNSLIASGLDDISSNALIEGNIFLKTGSSSSYTIENVNYSTIQNNVFLGSYYFKNCTGNIINKNIFTKNSNFNGNFYVAQTYIFVNQTGNAINYSHNYHLKDPATYTGTDGTQVGLYGGLGFKENGVPSTPAITSKTIATKTDSNGNLQVKITVKAQDN